MRTKQYYDYVVYENGDVFSNFSNKFLKKYISHDGYINYVIRIDKRSKRIGLHRLLAICFIDNPMGKETVNHIDGNKKNNSIDNLEWATHKENTYHAVLHGLSSRGKYRKNNSSGYVGVTLEKSSGRWVAQIKINYRCIKIGRYNTAKEASIAYWAKYNEYIGKC